MKEKVSNFTQNRSNILLAVVAVVILFMFMKMMGDKSASLGQPPEEPQITATVGNAKDAPRIVAYIDPLCPRCKEYHEDTLVKVKEQYVDANKLRVEVRLLSIIAKESAPLVQFAMCGNEQGVFWDSLSFLYKNLYRENGKTPTDNAVRFFTDYPNAKLAKLLKLDESKLASCLAENKYIDKIITANKEAVENGVTGTPATFIPGTEKLGGYVTYDQIKPLLEHVK